MSTSRHVTWFLLASLTLASSALAQSAADSATPPAPKDKVEDLTATTLASPPAASASPATAPPLASSTAPNSAPGVEPSPRPMSPETQPAMIAPQSSPTATPVVDPESTVRHGFYLRLGQGMSYVALAGDGPLGSASIKGLGSGSLIAIGGSIARGVVLAGTLQASSLSATFKRGPFEGKSVALADRSVSASSKADAAFSQIGLLIDWLPNPTKGWHVGASGGLGSVGIINRADESTQYGFGFTGTLFGGYDWRIAKEWSIGLALVASGMTTSTIKYSDDGADTGYRLRGLSLGISGSVLYF